MGPNRDRSMLDGYSNGVVKIHASATFFNAVPEAAEHDTFTTVWKGESTKPITSQSIVASTRDLEEMSMGRQRPRSGPRHRDALAKHSLADRSFNRFRSRTPRQAARALSKVSPLEAMDGASFLSYITVCWTGDFLSAQ